MTDRRTGGPKRGRYCRKFMSGASCERHRRQEHPRSQGSGDTAAAVGGRAATIALATSRSRVSGRSARKELRVAVGRGTPVNRSTAGDLRVTIGQWLALALS